MSRDLYWGHLVWEEGMGVLHGQGGQSVGEEDKLVSLRVFISAKKQRAQL